MVAQSPVKRLVVGSNPTRGAKLTLKRVFVLLREKVICITFVVGGEALFPYLREIPIVSKWERGTVPVRKDIPTHGAFIKQSKVKTYKGAFFD